MHGLSRLVDLPRMRTSVCCQPQVADVRRILQAFSSFPVGVVCPLDVFPPALRANVVLLGFITQAVTTCLGARLQNKVCTLRRCISRSHPPFAATFVLSTPSYYFRFAGSYSFVSNKYMQRPCHSQGAPSPLYHGQQLLELYLYFSSAPLIETWAWVLVESDPGGTMAGEVPGK